MWSLRNSLGAGWSSVSSEAFSHLVCILLCFPHGDRIRAFQVSEEARRHDKAGRIGSQNAPWYP
jgi:hypothetical protein